VNCRAAFACLKNDVLAVKLGAGTREHTAALALAGSELFDPSGKKRPFEDRVAVPIAHADRWPELAKAALAQQPELWSTDCSPCQHPMTPPRHG
jgi:hypothetical protein